MGAELIGHARTVGSGGAAQTMQPCGAAHMIGQLLRSKRPGGHYQQNGSTCVEPRNVHSTTCGWVGNQPLAGSSVFRFRQCILSC